MKSSRRCHFSSAGSRGRWTSGGGVHRWTLQTGAVRLPRRCWIAIEAQGFVAMPEVAVAESSFQRMVLQDFAKGGATKLSRRRESEVSDPTRALHRASPKISRETLRIPGNCPAPIAMALRAFTSSAAIRWKRGFQCARMPCNLIIHAKFDRQID